jgi:hypothetical protein
MAGVGQIEEFDMQITMRNRFLFVVLLALGVTLWMLAMQTHMAVFIAPNGYGFPG